MLAGSRAVLLMLREVLIYRHLPDKGLSALCHLPQVVHIHVFYPTNQYPTPQFCNTMQFLNIACNDIIPDKIPDLANFRQFFCHKGGQMLFDLNFDARFGILSSFSIYQEPICYHFHVLNFLSTYVIIGTKMQAAPQFLEKM